VLGDSFSEHGWPGLLAGETAHPEAPGRLREIWPECVLNNFAVGGAHASGWLGIQTDGQNKFYGNGERMFRTNWPALLAFDPDLTVVFIGGNDFKEFPHQDPAITIQTITSRVGTLIDRLRERNPKMRILLACYDDPYDGWSSAAKAPDPNAETSSAILQLCNAYERLAREKGCDSVCRTIYDSFMNHGWGKELGGPAHQEPTYTRPYHPQRPDLHPSPAGQQALADIFYEKFREMAGVPASGKLEEPQRRPGAERAESTVPNGPYAVRTREITLGEYGEYRLYEPEGLKPTCADIWVNGGKVSGYKVYEFRHRIIASWGITVMASATDPVVAKNTGLSNGLHTPAIEYLRANGYHEISLSGHSGGAGSAAIASRRYAVKAVTCWGGGGQPGGKQAATLILTGTMDANPEASFEMFDATEGPAFLGSYIDANHVYTETMLGWDPKSPYHAGTVQFVRLTLAWLQCWLQGKSSDELKNVDPTPWDVIKRKSF
jgi:lysophospholipase L1-like esterase